MKSGRKKIELPANPEEAVVVEPQIGGDVEMEEEEKEDQEAEEERGEEEAEAEAEEEAKTDTSHPKLAEGYYEIEEIRRKRIRKGKNQYLIKWRGWPESANTWEPLENLLSCRDIIDAFEESLRSKSFRKRKRKSGIPHFQFKKKRGSSKMEVDGQEKMAAAEKEEVGQVELPAENGQEYIPMQQMDGELNTSNKDCGNISINLTESRLTQEDGTSVDGCSKVENVQNGRFTGARKRKSGYVRRFIQDLSSGKTDATVKSANGNGEKLEGNGVEPLDGEAGLEGLTSAPYITKLLKAIRYSASVTTNDQNVLVTFMALRSDGKEVLVDNNFLKANNPQLLISFYEQHLRYSPT